MDQKTATQTLSPAEACAISKEATIYGFPLVDSFRIQYSYFVDRKNPEYKAPWNTIVNNARVYTPDDKAIADAELGHTVLVCGRRPTRRTAGVHGAGSRNGSLLRASVHRHVHVRLRLCGEPH